jgi:lipocalin
MSTAPTNVSASDASDRKDEESPVTTVKAVDLERYVGLWYEIAKIPNRFQKQCVSGTTAEYTLREDGRITVVNQCVKKDGEVDDAEGIAKVVDTTTNTKLKVSFVSFPGSTGGYLPARRGSTRKPWKRSVPSSNTTGISGIHSN